MKKLRAVIIFGILSSSNAFAVAGAMLTTDLNAYQYAISTIKKIEDQTKELVSLSKTADLSYEKLTAMKRQLDGSINRVTGFMPRMAKQAEKFGENTQNFSDKTANDYDSFTRNDGSLNEDDGADGWKKVEVNIDDMFCDKREASCVGWEANEKKRVTRQKILKDSLIRATMKIEETKEELTQISDLGTEIGKGTTRDEQNLTNRLLLELLAKQQDLVSLVAQLLQAITVTQYDGLTTKGKGQQTVRDKDIKTIRNKAMSNLRSVDNIKNYGMRL